MLLFADITQWLGLGAGMLILAWVVMRRRFRALTDAKHDSRATLPSTVFQGGMLGGLRAARQPSTGLMDAPNSIARWEIGMHEVARDMRAELDSKMVALNVLIARACDESDKLTLLVRRAERLGLSAVPDPLQAVADLNSDDRRIAQAAEDQLRHATHGAAGILPPLADQIYALADEGRQAKQIACQLGAPLGEVEFALGLRRDLPATGLRSVSRPE